jgi:hypothetical protein
MNSELINKVKSVLDNPKQRLNELFELCKTLCNHAVNINCSSCVTEGVMLLTNWIKENNIKLEAQNYFRKAVNGEYEFKPLNLFVQYYQQDNPERQKEIDACSKLNHSLKHFNKVFSLTERLTYKQIFELTNDYADCINVISNSDIYFNETILFSRFMREDDCYALSRWDYQENGLAVLFDRKDSQDAWVFNGAVKKIQDGNYNLGTAGCDNRIAWELKQAGYNVLNPSKTIHSIHLHLSNHRTYKSIDRISEPYHFIFPHH